MDILDQGFLKSSKVSLKKKKHTIKLSELKKYIKSEVLSNLNKNKS